MIEILVAPWCIYSLCPGSLSLDVLTAGFAWWLWWMLLKHGNTGLVLVFWVSVGSTAPIAFVNWEKVTGAVIQKHETWECYHFALIFLVILVRVVKHNCSFSGCPPGTAFPTESLKVAWKLVMLLLKVFNAGVPAVNFLSYQYVNLISWIDEGSSHL